MMRETLKLGLILGLVCMIAGASLAVTHAITSDIISARQEEKLLSKLQELLPEAESFETVEPEDGVVYYLGWRGKDIVGAILEGKAKGYGGDMRFLVAVDVSGKIGDMAVLEHEETIGIGTRALQPDYLQQFRQRSYSEQLVAGKNVNLVTGATVSSRAVMSSVADALDSYQAYVLGINADDAWDLAQVKDGIYEGVAPGFKSDVKVKVSVEAGRIAEVKVVSIGDTPEVYPDAMQQVPQRIVDKQHWQVDAVSGATLSSKGIMEAVRAAIPETGLKFDQIADGIYEGKGQGFGGEIKVKVEVADGKLKDIAVLMHKESDYVSDPALAQIPKAIIAQQSVKVDVVTGATYTSQGLIEAVTNALADDNR